MITYCTEMSIYMSYLNNLNLQQFYPYDLVIDSLPGKLYISPTTVRRYDAKTFNNFKEKLRERSV